MIETCLINIGQNQTNTYIFFRHGCEMVVKLSSLKMFMRVSTKILSVFLESHQYALFRLFICHFFEFSSSCFLSSKRLDQILQQWPYINSLCVSCARGTSNCCCNRCFDWLFVYNVPVAWFKPVYHRGPRVKVLNT